MVQKNKQLLHGVSEEEECIFFFFLQYKDRAVPGERSKNQCVIPGAP